MQTTFSSSSSDFLHLECITIALSIATTDWFPSCNNNVRTRGRKCRRRSVCGEEVGRLGSLAKKYFAGSLVVHKPQPSQKPRDPSSFSYPRVPPYPISAASAFIVSSGVIRCKFFPSPRTRMLQYRKSLRNFGDRLTLDPRTFLGASPPIFSPSFRSPSTPCTH